MISHRDENSHFPEPDADPSWQESWAFAWYDPLQRLGGAQHIGLRRVEGLADVQSWVSHRGVLVHRYQKFDLAIPDMDYTDIRIGPLAVKTTTPLKAHEIRIEGDDFFAELSTQINLDPATFSYEVAHGHLELYGRTRGTVRFGGKTIPLAGHCFLDRSWGPRDWTSLIANRYFWASFGDDLVFKLIVLRMSDGASLRRGLVMRQGTVFGIQDVDAKLVMDSDGLLALSGEVTVWLNDGTAYHLTAECDGGEILLAVHDGFKASSQNAVYRCGGRVGTGFVIAQEMRSLPPWDNELLAMARTTPKPSVRP